MQSRKPDHSPKRRRKHILLWSAVSVVTLGVLGGFIAYRAAFGGYAPKELMQDIKAGVAAREIQDADQRFAKYLELRYGPMTDAANREKAFLDFFNPEHIRALQFMVQHSPAEQRLANINASANWVANYRSNLTAAERVALNEKLNSDTGRLMLKQATAQYNAQDIYYRGHTAVVISELLRTIHEVQRSTR